MEVTQIKEHEDGSATYTFDMSDEERQIMTENGILWAIIGGITGITPDKAMSEYMESKKDDEWRG